MTTPLAQGTIVINDQQYIYDIDSVRLRDITDFSPPAAVPGSGTLYSDLGLYQPIGLLSFHHGFGFVWHTDEAGYLSSFGNIDTRHPNLVMLMSKATERTGCLDMQHNGGVAFGDYYYLWGSGGLERWSSGDDFETVDFKKVTVDTSAEGKVTASATLNAAFVVGADGSNGALLVLISCEGNVTVSAATYGGEALTAIPSFDSVAGSPCNHGLYKLTPKTGSNTIAITLSGATDWEYCILSLLNVDQDTPFGTPALDKQTGTGLTVAPASDAGDLVIDCLAKIGGSGDNLTIGAGQTQRALQSDANGTETQGAASSEEDDESGADTTMSWTWTNSRTAVLSAVSVKPSSSAVAINTVFSSGGYLFLCADGERIRKSSSGGITPKEWSDAGVNSRSADYKWMAMHAGFIFAGKDARSIVYLDDSETLADLCGDPDDDTAEIYFGASSVPTLKGLSFSEMLLCPREDGLWKVDETTDPYTARPVLSFVEETSSLNFADSISSGGYLYFPIRGILYRWNGTVLTDITPDRLSASFPFVTYGHFKNFVSHQKWLFYVARSNEETYTESILCWDGAGTHALAHPITDGEGTITFLKYDVINNLLWYGITVEGEPDVNTLYSIPFQEASDFPYADFPTTGSHGFITSRIDCGYRLVPKSLPFLMVQTQNCSAIRFVSVHYAIDNGDWIKWSDVKTNGLTILKKPNGLIAFSADSFLNLKFELVTNDSAQSPIFEGAILMAMLRPATRWGHTMRIVAVKGNQCGGFVETREPWQIKRDLKDTRDAVDPVAMISPDGEEIWGYLASVTVEPIQLRAGSDEQEVSLEEFFTIAFVETVESEESDE